MVLDKVTAVSVVDFKVLLWVLINILYFSGSDISRVIDVWSSVIFVLVDVSFCRRCLNRMTWFFTFSLFFILQFQKDFVVCISEDWLVVVNICESVVYVSLELSALLIWWIMELFMESFNIVLVRRFFFFYVFMSVVVVGVTGFAVVLIIMFQRFFICMMVFILWV